MGADKSLARPTSRCILFHGESVSFDASLVLYTGCPRRNVPDFGRMFLMLKYTDITQNTYIQSWTVTQIMGREKCGLLAVPRTVLVKPTRYASTAHVRPWEWNAVTLRVRYEWLVTCTELQKCLLCFPTWNIVTCILWMEFAMAMHVLLLTNTKGVFPTEGFRLGVYFLLFTRQCVRLSSKCYCVVWRGGGTND